MFWISAKSKLVRKRCNLCIQKIRQISVVPYFLSWSDCMHCCCNCYLGLTPAIKICRHKENRKRATQPIFCLEIASLGQLSADATPYDQLKEFWVIPSPDISNIAHFILIWLRLLHIRCVQCLWYTTRLLDKSGHSQTLVYIAYLHFNKSRFARRVRGHWFSKHTAWGRG